MGAIVKPDGECRPSGGPGGVFVGSRPGAQAGVVAVTTAVGAETPPALADETR